MYWTQDEGAEESNPGDVIEAVAGGAVDNLHVSGRVDGSYSVWLPDGRLMTVAYYVDGESGFVPTITYTDNYTPQF